MRRLLITLGFPPAVGGMQAYLHRRCRAAPTHEIRVLAPSAPGCEDFDKEQPFTIHRWSPVLHSIPGIRRFMQVVLPLFHAVALCRRWRFSIVECGQALPLGLIGWLLREILGTPYLIWTFGRDVVRPQGYPPSRWLLRSILCQADAVVAVSVSTRDEVIRLGVDPTRVLVIPPAVDPEAWACSASSETIKTRHGLKDRRIVLTVARLVERKGVDTVIRAMPRVLQAIPDVNYLVVGEGPQRPRLEQLARELGLHEAVVFAGHVPKTDLSAYYHACEAFVMVSRALPHKGDVEGFGIVYLEAGSCGKPIVAGRGGGVEEAVEDGVTGLLVDPLDVDGIARAIVRVLEDEGLARRLGENGRKRAMRQPDWDLLESTPHW